MNEKANKIKIYLTSLLEKYAPESVVLLDLLCDMISESIASKQEQSHLPETVSQKVIPKIEFQEEEEEEDYDVSISELIKKYDPKNKIVYLLKNTKTKNKYITTSSIYKIITIIFEYQKDPEFKGLNRLLHSKLGKTSRYFTLQFFQGIGFLEKPITYKSPYHINPTFSKVSSFEEFFYIIQNAYENIRPSCLLFKDLKKDFLHHEVTHDDPKNIQKNEPESPTDFFGVINKSPICSSEKQKRKRVFDEDDVKDLQFGFFENRIDFLAANQRFLIEKTEFLEALYFFYLWDDTKESLTQLFPETKPRTLISRLMGGLGFISPYLMDNTRKIKTRPFSFENFRSFMAEVKARYEKICGPTDIFDIEG